METMENGHGACINKHCKLFTQENQGNIFIKAWLGSNKDVRLLYCKECKRHFLEDQNAMSFIY